MALDQQYRDAVRALNSAAYGAARAATKAGQPSALRLKQIALELDDMVDALPSEQRAA